MARKKRQNTAPRVRRMSPIKIDFEISYKNHEDLFRFLNDRAKISGRKRTGITAKQQKKVTREVKRARHLGLLPFKARV
jgi:small subunit ribosomal protein S18